VLSKNAENRVKRKEERKERIDERTKTIALGSVCGIKK